MNIQSEFYSGAVKSLLHWAGIMALSLILFSSFVVPVHAAEDTGWIEASVTVPDGFEDNIIVCIVNQDTGDEFATRLMATNDYKFRMQVPAGNYSFDGAFLENGDFRYNTSLTNDASTFVVSSEKGALAAKISLETVYNEAFKDGAKLPEPTVASTTETVSDEQSVETTPVHTKGPQDSANASSDETTSVSGNKGDSADETTSDTAAETGSALNPSGEESTPSEDETDYSEEETGTSVTEVAETTADNKEAEGSFTIGQKILYGLLASGVFILIVFLGAFLYRRHLENS